MSTYIVGTSVDKPLAGGAVGICLVGAKVGRAEGTWGDRQLAAARGRGRAIGGRRRGRSRAGRHSRATATLPPGGVEQAEATLGDRLVRHKFDEHERASRIKAMCWEGGAAEPGQGWGTCVLPVVHLEVVVLTPCRLLDGEHRRPQPDVLKQTKG